MPSLLEVTDLTTELTTMDGSIRAVDNVTFSIDRGMTLGLVGESGSGKSMTALSILGLVPRNGEIVSGSVKLRDEDLLSKTESEMRAIRGDRLSIVFQDPLTALNPSLSIGRQIHEAITAHRDIEWAASRAEVIEALAAVRIPNPHTRAKTFPHESSGGMQQRILLAMAMVNRPDLLIADEPTTALDVTIQAQVLSLIRKLVQTSDTAVLLISHNLGVIAQMSDRVAVMYAGEIVEEADADELFDRPLHPYTKLLLESVPTGEPLKGTVSATKRFASKAGDQTGCRFRNRCPSAEDICGEHPSLVTVGSRSVRCWVALRTHNQEHGGDVLNSPGNQVQESDDSVEGFQV